MKTVIYADVLVLLNIFVNFFLLMITDLFTGRRAGRGRTVAGAAFGGASSLLLLMPPMHAAVSAAVKLAALLVTVGVAFGIHERKRYLRQTAVFVAANAGFAGLLLALDIMLSPDALIFENGAVYVDVGFGKLAVCVAAAYAITTVSLRILKKRCPDNAVGEICVEIFGRSVKGAALIDTGNSLSESFSGRAVAVAQLDFILPLLPAELCGFFLGGAGDTDAIPDAWLGRLRMIPALTVGGEGLLPAFRPDNVTFNGEPTGEIYIAVSREKLAGGEYSVLLPGGLDFEAQKEKKAYEKIV